MKELYTYKIDMEGMSRMLSLSEEKTFEWLFDGRPMGRLAEFLHEKVGGGTRQNEKSPFDVEELDGVKTEIRTITSKISFASSKEIGYGRTVTTEGYQEKLNSVDRFIAVDIRNLKNGLITFIEVTKDDLEKLKLGKNADISAEKFYEYYDRNK